MHVTLINPNICMQKGDFFGSGIPYMPMSLAFVAGYLRSKDFDITVIDAFGERPLQARKLGNLIIQGLYPEEICNKVPKDTDAIAVYAAKVVADSSTKEIVKLLRARFKIPIIMLENTQSVVAYSMRLAGQGFLDAGADYVIIGEGEPRLELLLHKIKQKKEPDFDGIIYRKGSEVIARDKQGYITNLDALPFPAWELFPLNNYWNLGYAHGPMQNKYIPLLTSRGCPYGCRYCIVPETNTRRWRARTAKNVVDEIEHWHKLYEINEFHWEDLNPTVRKDRIQEICKEIIARNLNISWKIVAGTKIETLDKETIDWMAKAGCRYVSISPESGSARVLQLMDKPFNHQLGLELVKHMHKLGMTVQACFVLGFPGEQKADRKLTRKYVRQLLYSGIDEVSLFIMTPIPGSKQYGVVKGYDSLSQLTFSPTWRADFRSLSWYRFVTYVQFYLIKAIIRPFKLLKQPINVLRKNFETKTEMTAYRTWRLIPIISRTKN